MEERESQRKVLSQKGEPARSHLCGIQALLPQAAAAQRPQPPRAWPGRVPADTPVSVPLSVNALGVASTATAPLLGGGRK